MRVPAPSPPGHPGGTSHSDSEKAEFLVDTLETQFQPVADLSVPAVIDMIDVALRFYFQLPASGPTLTKPDEVYEAIRSLKVGNAPGPNGIPYGTLIHLPQRAASLLGQIFKAFLTRYFPSLWKHARVTSILKPGKDPLLPSSYEPISLLDSIGKQFEKIILARVLHVVRDRGLLRDEQFGFRPRHRTSLQLACLVERITRNIGEKRLSGGFPRRGRSLRYCLNQWPPLQSNTP